MPKHQTVIQAEARLFSDLFHQGRFAVPWHQRYYDWTPRDVRALLQDIEEALKEERDCYFLGAIMLVELGDCCWEINDGQQRMVTLSLMFAALCRHFVRHPRGSQREGLALRILFDLDANSVCTLQEADRYTPRISPPRNDAMRYRQMIRGNTIGTNGKLTEAWTEIDGFFSVMDHPHLERYFDFLIEKLEVACLRLPPHVDSNAVYETINCRGKKLDDFDLIRNFLYSHFNSEIDSERRISVHESLERIRTILPSSKKASEYIRCNLQCSFGFLRKDYFYRDVREAIRNQSGKEGPPPAVADYVFELTERVTSGESIELFRNVTVSNPDPDFVRAFQVASGTTGSRRNLAVFLRELRGYTITQPLVFAILAWYVGESDGRKRRRIARTANRNLSRLATFVLRTAFVVPKFEPSHFETEFSNYARDVATSDDIPDEPFAAFLKDCDKSAHGVLDDKKFQDALVEAKMTATAKIKHFLLGVNASLQRDAALLREDACTIEHILPKSPEHWSGWPAFRDLEGSDWIHRLGNLTLLGPSDNKPGVEYNGTFAAKCQTYKESSLALTRDLLAYNHWAPTAIEARQLQLAKRALRVWTFV